MSFLLVTDVVFFTFSFSATTSMSRLLRSNSIGNFLWNILVKNPMMRGLPKQYSTMRVMIK